MIGKDKSGSQVCSKSCSKHASPGNVSDMYSSFAKQLVYKYNVILFIFLFFLLHDAIVGNLGNFAYIFSACDVYRV